MFKLSKLIYLGLKADANVQALFNGNIFQLIANESAIAPFIIYKVKSDGLASKEGVSNYTVIIHNYANDYDAALENAEIINTALKAVMDQTDLAIYKFNEVSKEPDLTEDFKQVFVEQIYNIKL